MTVARFRSIGIAPPQKRLHPLTVPAVYDRRKNSGVTLPTTPKCPPLIERHYSIPQKSSGHRPPLQILVLLLTFALTLTTQAETTPFESPADLALYTTHLTANTTFAQEPAIGAGSPASGGLRFQGTTNNNDRGAAARRAVAASPATISTWQSSILVNLREVRHPEGTFDNNQGQLRLGFSADNAIDTAKPWEYFHKSNPSICLRLRARNRSGSPDALDVELVNLQVANGSDTKGGILVQNSSPFFSDWLRVTFTLNRTGATTFGVTYHIESLGLDGTAAPQTVMELTTPVAFTNAALANATTVFSGFTLQGEKLFASSIYLDDHSTTATVSAPPAPTALAATQANSVGFKANWQPSAGLPAQSWLLEVTTQADNFAPNTFLAANGTPGQASGITIADPATLSLAISNLSALQTYVYRVTALNSIGSSAPSNVESVTLPEGNAPPGIHPITDVGPIASYHPPLSIPLSGINAGGEPGQTVTLTATSSNPSVIPHPSISYTAPATTGSLTLQPAGPEGTATITVTLDDGQAEDNLTSVQFQVTVSNPPVNVGFNDPADTATFFNLTNLNTNAQHSANGGAAGSGGMSLRVNTFNQDTAWLALRNQTYPLAGATEIVSSLKFNAREIDNTPDLERKADIRLGLSPTNTISPSKPDEFFHKSNHGIHAKIKVENKAGAPRVIEVELESFNGSEAKAAKLTLPNAAEFDDWLQIDFSLIPIGGSDFLVSYTLFSLGLDGTATPTPLLQSAPFTFTNASFAAASQLFAGVAIKIDKKNTASEGLFIDDHRVEISTDPAAAPSALAATRVTAASFNANWQPGPGAYATGYVLEVVSGTADFTPGNFLSATGSLGQSNGIPVTSNATRTLRISGLNPASTYRYRVIGTNLNGPSTPSTEVSLTTLAAGQNAVPTLDPIPDPAPLAENTGAQTIPLTGISAGGELSQTLTVTATSSNPALIPNPTITYTSPSETGSLTFTPTAGAVGSAVITVTVNDGAANNNTFSQTFNVFVVSVDPLLTFEDPDDLLMRLGRWQQNGSLVVHNPTGGIGTPGTGGVELTGQTPGLDRLLLGIRPTAYDAASAGYLITSMMVNFSEVVNATTKDDGEIRLGFMTQNTPNLGKLNDTLHKTPGNASLGVKFKVEHEPANPSKNRLIEAELFSGPSDTKAGKQSLINQDLDRWFKVTLYAVRLGLSSYGLTYIIEDFGTDGITPGGQVMAAGPFTFTSAAFATDTSVFSAFTVKGAKENSGPLGSTLYFDQHEAHVNTTAPFAPIAEEPFDIDFDTATLSWLPSPLGRAPQGFLVELIPASGSFEPGQFLSASGQPGQASGIVVNDPAATELLITGLTHLTDYRYRVFAFSNSDLSAARNIRDFTTADLPLYLGPTDVYQRNGLVNREIYAEGAADADATIIPGSPLITSGVETLTVGMSLSLGAYTRVIFELGQSNYTRLATHTLLPIHETVKFEVHLQPNFAPQGGEVFDILDWNVRSPGGDPDLADNLELPTLPGDLTWDTSLFHDQGIIRINGTPQPLQVSQPGALAMLPGQPATFAIIITGAAPWIIEWLKDGQPIPGKTTPTLAFTAVTENDDAFYSARVSNGNQTLTTQPVRLNVYDPPTLLINPEDLTINPGESATFSVIATSEFGDLHYQWLFNGTPIPNAADASTYTIAKAQKTNQGTYSVAVSNPAGTTLSDEADLFVNNPVVITSQPQNIATTAGQTVQFSVTATGTGSLSYQWQFDGQDLPGETSDTLQVTASADTVGRYRVRISNLVGALWSLSATLTLEGALVGKFTAPLDRDPMLNANLGGRLDLTTTAKNTFSGKVTLGASSHSFRGSLIPDPNDPNHATGTAEIKRGRNSPLTLTFTLGPDAIDSATLFDPLSTATLALRGWRNVWHSRNNPPTIYAGYHTLGFNLPESTDEARPEGTPHASFTIHPKTGTLTLAGRLADGTAFTSATFVGPHGELLVFRTLYPAKARGSVIGTLQIAKADQNKNNLVGGELSWWRPASAGRLYPAGFGPFDMEAVGSRYDPPPLGEIVMDLDLTDPEANNAMLHLSGADIEGKLADPNRTSIPLRVDSRHRSFVDAAFATNRITIKIAPKTGLITGSFRISEPHPFPINPNRIPALTRTGSFRALLIRDATGLSARGFFLLAQLPTELNQKAAAIPMLSGQIQLAPTN